MMIVDNRFGEQRIGGNMMCRESEYQNKLFFATCAISELENITSLFYPEGSTSDNTSLFNLDDFEAACDKVIAGLSELNRLNTKKNYSDEHIAEKIFDELDAKWYFILNTQTIIRSIKRKKEQLIGFVKTVSNITLLAGDFLAFNDILIDTSTFLLSFAKWKDIETYSWLSAYMRKTVSPFEVFGSGIYMSKRIAHINDFSIPPLAIFLLRQAIELKVCEILNIHVIIDESNNVVKITGDKLLPLLNENNFILPVKKSILEKIHKWANAYVHLGVIDSFWKVEFAQFYLMDLFSIMNKMFALKSYYESELQTDIQRLVKGNCKVIPLNTAPLYVELLDAENFNKIHEDVKKIGFSKFCERREQEYLSELELRAKMSRHS